MSKQKCSNLRPLLSITFPQGFRRSKNFGHPTLGSGGKKTFKRYLKCEQTDRHTHGQTDISTYRKHRPRGPMLLKISINIKTSLLRSLQMQTLPNATPPIGKIPPFSKIIVTLEPGVQC